MGLITISGQRGCRIEEVARISAHQLGFELVTASRLATLIPEEFGYATEIPDKAYSDVIASVIGPLATQHHLVLCLEGAELLARYFSGMLRIQIVARESVRAGNLMLDRRLDRVAAKEALLTLDAEQQALFKRRFRRRFSPPELFDMVLNSEFLASEHLAGQIACAARAAGIAERGFLSAASQNQMRFRVRLGLAKHGLVPPDKVGLPRKSFVHPSEEIFANLLDFYRIAWEYEPRTFPIQWDRDGKISEAFTPDFYLAEFDLYVELTTMKQSLVTKKNRKVKLLREIYPHINIQVFYQKDFENLIFKYGLAEKTAQA